MSLGNLDGRDAVAISGGSDASITATVNTTTAAPGDVVRATWLWRQDPSVMLRWHHYVTAEVSTDRGASWVLLAGTGMSHAPGEWTSAGALLPREAFGLVEVLLRFRAPDTAQQDALVPIWIDDVSVILEHPQVLDEIGDVRAEPEGTFRAELDLTEPGRRALFCEWHCGEQELISNAVDLEHRGE